MNKLNEQISDFNSINSMNIQLFKYRLIKTKPKCSNNSNSLTQVKSKIFMLRVSNQLSQVQHQLKQTEQQLEKKVKLMQQVNNKMQQDNNQQQQLLMDSKMVKSQKA